MTADDGREILGPDGREILDPVVAAAARTLREPVSLDPGLDARIMAAVWGEGAPGSLPSGVTAEWDTVAAPARAARPGPARRRAAAAWAWLREPRTLLVSPLAGLVGLAAAALLAVVLVQGGQEQGGASQVTPALLAAAPDSSSLVTRHSSLVDTVQVVQFVLVAPTARTVALVGDFNDWDAGATPLRTASAATASAATASAGRVWSVEVPLSPGRHRYAFVVDGEEWVPDPTAPTAPGADFGAPSSVVTVAGRSS